MSWTLISSNVVYVSIRHDLQLNVAVRWRSGEEWEGLDLCAETRCSVLASTRFHFLNSPQKSFIVLMNARGPAMDRRISICVWTAVIALLCIEKSLCTPRIGGVDLVGRKPNAPSRGGIKTNLIELRGQNLPCHGNDKFQKRIGRNCEQNSTTQSVYGPGNYLMQMSFGTPPQKFTLILDARSDLVWVQCRPCTTCSMAFQATFDPAMSNTFTNVSCDDQICSNVPNRGCEEDECAYQNNDDDNKLVAQGRLFKDTLSLLAPGFVNLKLENFGFGCSEQNVGLQVLQVDGVVGFGRGPLSLISQMGSVYGNRFSYCLKRNKPNNGLFNNVGPSKLTLGDIAVPSKEDQKVKKVQWSPFIKNDINPSLYLLDLQGISINGKKIKVPGLGFKIEKGGKRGTVLDIGVKISKLQQTIFDTLTQALEPLIDYKKVSEVFGEYKQCYTVPQGPDPLKFPDISLHFQGGANVAVPGDKAFLDVQSTTGQRTMCLAADATDGTFNVLGSAWQHGIEVIVDNEADKVGFSGGDCNAPSRR